jgi:branched-chain amino acid transport system permease protein
VPLVVQVAVTGLAAGAGYGLVAIAFALVYRLTGVIHFALGELIGLSIFVTLWLAAGTGPVTRTNLPAGGFVIALAGGLAVAMVVGAGAYLLGVRPFLRTGSILGWIAALVAMAFAVRGLLSAVLTRQGYVFPDPIPFDRLGHGGVLLLGGGVTLQIRTFFVLAVGFALAAASSAFLERSAPGKALRAISLDQDAARLLGLPVERLLVGAFAFSGALAALAGVVAAPAAPAVSPDTGALLGLKGLAAALLGRFGSPWAVFGAGLAVGVLETTVSAFHLGGVRLGPAYRDLVPLALAIAVMAARRARELAAETE